MLKKIFGTIKKYHRIIFPIIAAIFYKLKPRPPFEDYSFTLDLLFTISLIISVVSIAIWLKKSLGYIIYASILQIWGVGICKT